MKSEVASEFTSELANKYGKRFKKYGSKMFTFLEHDGVPWNNNNAEHAIHHLQNIAVMPTGVTVREH